MFVVRDFQVESLSRPALVKLRLVARLDHIDQQRIKKTYPKLCDRPGVV